MQALKQISAQYTKRRAKKCALLKYAPRFASTQIHYALPFSSAQIGYAPQNLVAQKNLRRQ